MTVRVRGDSPLVTNQFSAKAKQAMLDKMQLKKATRTKRNPLEDYEASKYLNEQGECCVRAVSFKCAAIDATLQLKDEYKKAFLMGAFHIIGELLPIQGSEPKMREDAVTLWSMNKKTHDLRYRAEFFPWFIDVPIVFNATSISLENLLNLFRHAGFSCGVGEYRPQKRGNWGMFTVEAVTGEEDV